MFACLNPVIFSILIVLYLVGRRWVLVFSICPYNFYFFQFLIFISLSLDFLKMFISVISMPLSQIYPQAILLPPNTNPFIPSRPPVFNHRCHKCCNPHEGRKNSQTDVLFIAPQPGITKHLHLLPIRGDANYSFMDYMYLGAVLFLFSLVLSKYLFMGSQFPTVSK